MQSFSRSAEQPIVAVAGATGDLGTRLTDTFLSAELRPGLSGVVSLARRRTPNTQRWESMGADIRIVDDSCDERDLVMALEGVDVLVNAISTPGAKFRDKLVSVLPQTSVKLYIPSEFGVDHTLHDFSIPEWDGKKHHYELTKKVLQGTDIQVCRLFNGLFLHSGIGPWYGFHTSKDVYQVVGSVDQSNSYTDISDIARVVCILAQKAMSGEQVPAKLRIGGSQASVRQVAQAMTEAGAGDIELRSVNLEEFRSKALGRDYQDRGPIVCLRFLMGDGRIDYRPQIDGGLGNDNELVNPGQKQFIWKSISDLAAETKGRPNANA